MENRSSEPKEVTAEFVMQRLKRDAKQLGDDRRIGTLGRLVAACDDIISGRAYRYAVDAGEDAVYFNPSTAKLNPGLIERYIRLRSRLDVQSSYWTGPVASTIRGDVELRLYVKLRSAEHRPVSHSSLRRSRHQRSRVDEVIDGLEGLHDQALLRDAIAQGRLWKTQLDTLLKALRKIPEIDVEALWEGKGLRPQVVQPRSPSALSPDEILLLRALVVRVQDNDLLEEFDLIYRSNRLKMSRGLGLDLIYPAEMKLLERIAGLMEAQGER